VSPNSDPSLPVRDRRPLRGHAIRHSRWRHVRCQWFQPCGRHRPSPSASARKWHNADHRQASTLFRHRRRIITFYYYLRSCTVIFLWCDLHMWRSARRTGIRHLPPAYSRVTERTLLGVDQNSSVFAHYHHKTCLNAGRHHYRRSPPAATTTAAECHNHRYGADDDSRRIPSR